MLTALLVCVAGWAHALPDYSASFIAQLTQCASIQNKQILSSQQCAGWKREVAAVQQVKSEHGVKVHALVKEASADVLQGKGGVSAIALLGLVELGVLLVIRWSGNYRAKAAEEQPAEQARTSHQLVKLSMCSPMQSSGKQGVPQGRGCRQGRMRRDSAAASIAAAAAAAGKQAGAQGGVRLRCRCSWGWRASERCRPGRSRHRRGWGRGPASRG